MSEEEILRDFVDNEQCEYVYDWQGFDWKTICPAVDKILKENKELRERIDKAIEYINEHIRNDEEYDAYCEMYKEDKEELLKILEGDK